MGVERAQKKAARGIAVPSVLACWQQLLELSRKLPSRPCFEGTR